MASQSRDKQLIIRITENERENFHRFCRNHDLQASGLIHHIIKRLLDGSLSLNTVLGAVPEIQGTPLQVVEEKIQKLTERLAQLEGTNIQKLQ